MFNYLYYKLYNAALRSSVKDIPSIAASTWFAVLISANILVVSGFLSKTINMPFIFSNSKLGVAFTAILIFSVMMYYGKQKREALLEKYSQETEKKRIKGNVIVSAYVALSFLLIFAVAFFRPGRI